MIYTMMYMNVSSQLEVLRYDSDTKMYQFTKAEIPAHAQLDDVRYQQPTKNQVFLAYEATEAEKSKLPEVPPKEGATSSWLKPIGEFHAAYDERTKMPVEHAYMLIDQLHKDRAIPSFFDTIINMLKQAGILNPDGTQNPAFKTPFTTAAAVDMRTGLTAERVLH